MACTDSKGKRLVINRNRSMRRVIHILLASASTIALLTCKATPASAQMPGTQASKFVGAWCAQGDPSKHASISDNGAFLNLTNENGDTSIGNYQGSNQISAPGWQFVTGTLSGDSKRINWSNGTFWARCPSVAVVVAGTTSWISMASGTQTGTARGNVRFSS